MINSFILRPANSFYGFEVDIPKQVWYLKLTGQWKYDPENSRSWIGFFNSPDPNNLAHIKLDTFYHSYDHLPTKDYKTAVLYKLLRGYRLRDEAIRNNQVFLGNNR